MIRKLKQIDYVMLLIVCCFAVVSTIIIYSATVGTRFEGKHIENLIMYVGFLLPLLLAMLIDYRFIVKYFVYVLYGLGVVLLVYVLINGVNINNSVRWVDIFGVRIQPSEFVKLFLILIFAKWIDRRDGELLRVKHDILPMMAMVAIPFVLVLKQPDLGTALIFICIFLAMLWMGNIRKWHMLIGFVSVLLIIGGFVVLYKTNLELFSKIIEPHWLKRIEAFIDPESDPGNSFHPQNAMKAISIGELLGRGFKQGYYVQSGLIPYDYADSIYVVIGEEFGFLGAASILLLYFLLIYRMIRIVLVCSDKLGSHIIIGIVAMLTAQIFENVAMHIGLMPMTGIALPFVSYGGSSLLTNMIAIGLVLNVKIHQEAEDQ